MRLVRFDPEVAVAVDAHGSRFSIGPLTGDGTVGRVQLAYLRAGGTIGRHPAAADQLFAVVAGSGTVSGDVGTDVPIRTGWGAVWTAGEVHGAATSDGLTAVVVEGSFEVWSLAVTQEIDVVPHDPAWAGSFASIVEAVWPALAGLAVRIDHVGSTSVPGLAAKPIIDLDVVVGSADGVRPAIDALAKVGYRWRGDLGVQGREAFAAPTSDLPRHHLYVVVEDNKAHVDHWLLRDVLRDDPGLRAKYAALKQHNATTSGGNMDRYVAAKAGWVASVLRTARRDRGLPDADYWEPDLDAL